MLPIGTPIKCINMQDNSILITKIEGYSLVTNNYKLSNGFYMCKDLTILGFNHNVGKSYIMYKCFIYKSFKRYKRRYKRK